MDVTSLLIGFLTGATTGAAGTYLADKFTDQRREKQRAKEKKQLWSDIEKKFPLVIAEMMEDFLPTKNRHVRAFFVKKSTAIMGFVSEPAFEYCPEKHPDIRAAVLYLQQHGFISDITTGNCPMYRIHEKMIDQLLKK